GTGFVHAVTWLLLGSADTWYEEVPAEKSDPVLGSTDPRIWLAKLRGQIKDHSDIPLQQMPCETSVSFRLRTKSWYFVFWLFARHPQRWYVLVRAFAEKGGQTPEECAAVFESVLGVKVGDLEAEWRDWAAGESAMAKVSGHGLGK